MQLANEQIQTVQHYLMGIRLSAELREELLDHLCCEIETALTSGQSFDTALQKTLSNWNQQRLRRLNNSILFTKYQPMFLRFTAIAASLALLLWINPFQKENATAHALNTPATEQAVAPTANPAPLTIPILASDIIERPTASPLRGMALTDAHSGFGMRRHPITKKLLMHRGIDLVAPLGTPVYATANGQVIFAGPNGDNGIQVRIAHEGGYTTVYNHLQEALVKEFDVVNLGAQIAKVGNTGASTGPHLHYEIWHNDEAIDPC
ncbi:MAG: M23 family metallopeptidase [Bacteroidota bacterium]